MNSLKHLFFSLFIFATCNFLAQQNDSLVGFNSKAAARKAQERNLTGAEINFYIKYLEREFINQKYNLKSRVYEPQKNSKAITTVNPPCTNVDFESLPLGVLQNSSGWTISESYNNIPNPILCDTGSFVFVQTPTISAFVVSTPYSDNIIGTIPASPLGGNNVLQLGSTTGGSYCGKISQTFSVTSSNCIYKYAIKGVILWSGHLCCDQGSLICNFRDCSDNIISCLSKTITPPYSNTCPFSYPLNWTSLNPQDWFMPNWAVITENLSSYIGSCITVEVIASGCTMAGHAGYCYYDAKCLSSVFSVNSSTLSTNSFTTCSNSATLNATSGLSSYSWNGPPGSGISSNTNTSITATTSGVYTLSANSCTNTITETFTLTINDPLINNISINTASLSICQGDSVSLQTNPGNFSSYLWNTSATSNSIVVAPLITTVYSVTATNSLGCISSDTKTIIVNPLPQAQIITSTSIICLGQSTSIYLANTCPCSYLWSNGATSPSISVSPTTTSVYTLMVTDAIGCSNNATQSIIVNLCTGIKTLSAEGKKIKIYPNPSFEKFTVEGKSNEEISITDESGKILLRITLSEKENYSRTFYGFPAGVYFVKTSAETIKVIVK